MHDSDIMQKDKVLNNLKAIENRRETGIKSAKSVGLIVTNYTRHTTM